MSTLTCERILVETTRFGALELDAGLAITLPDGLIGLGPSRRFVLVQPDPENPIKWLQSLEDGALAVPVLEPGFFMPDYAPVITEYDAERIGLTGTTPQVVLCIVTIPRDHPERMTANLVGPVVINGETRVGRQVIIDEPGYSTKHCVLDAIRLRRASERDVA